MLKKLTITFSLLFLNFTACTTKEKYSGNSEQVEPQPVVISGKNAFNLSNGTVQCAYLPKTATQYSLFCHAYVKSTSSQRSLLPSKSMTSLLGESTESLLLASEFEAGVSLEWNVPQIQSAQNPMNSQSCKVENGGLGYVCDLEFSEAVVSIESLKMEVAAIARDDKGTTVTQTTTTDVRDKNAIADEVLVEKVGRSISQYITFDALKVEEVEIKKEESNSTYSAESAQVLITNNNYQSAGTYCTPRHRTDLGKYNWAVVCVLKVLIDGKLVQATGIDSSIRVLGGSFQLETDEAMTGESFSCTVEKDSAKMYCSLQFSPLRFVDNTSVRGSFSFNLIPYKDSDFGGGGGGGGGSSGGSAVGNNNDVGTIVHIDDESELSFSL